MTKKVRVNLDLSETDIEIMKTMIGNERLSITSRTDVIRRSIRLLKLLEQVTEGTFVFYVKQKDGSYQANRIL
jgi:hypothetical protein